MMYYPYISSTIILSYNTTSRALVYRTWKYTQFLHIILHLFNHFALDKIIFIYNNALYEIF